MKNEIPKQKSGVQTRYIGGESLLIDGEKSYAINPSAAFIWNLCDGAHTFEMIVKVVHIEFTFPNGIDVYGEIKRILLDFHEKDLLEGID